MSNFRQQLITVLRRSVLLACCVAMLPLVSITAQDSGSGGSSGPFDKNDLKAFLKDTIWWDPYAGCSGSEGTTLSGGDNPAKAFNFFTGKGLSNEEAAAIVGNLMQESGVSPTAANTAGGTGGSIAQWEGDRWTKFMQFASGKDPHDLAVQLEFMWAELNGTAPASKQPGLAELKAASGVDGKTKAFEEAFERAGNPQMDKRIKFAQDILAKAGGGGGGGASSSSTGGSSGPCTSSSSGNAQAMVDKAKSYAWPDGSHGAELKPEYKQALANKEWNPSGNAGLDCGVFIALVVRSSGADPQYPGIGTGEQLSYVKSKPDKWEIVPAKTTSDLKPGDILIIGGGGAAGHTQIFLGPQGATGGQKGENGGTGYDAASASLGSRAANFDKAEIQDSMGRGAFTVARLKG